MFATLPIWWEMDCYYIVLDWSVGGIAAVPATGNRHCNKRCHTNPQNTSMIFDCITNSGVDPDVSQGECALKGCCPAQQALVAVFRCQLSSDNSNE